MIKFICVEKWKSVSGLPWWVGGQHGRGLRNPPPTDNPAPSPHQSPSCSWSLTMLCCQSTCSIALVLLLRHVCMCILYSRGVTTPSFISTTHVKAKIDLLLFFSKTLRFSPVFGIWSSFTASQTRFFCCDKKSQEMENWVRILYVIGNSGG